MKILLTGATGFVGSAVMRHLATEYSDIRVLIRDTSNRQHLNKYDLDIRSGDLRDIRSLEAAVDECDVVIHTAADYRIWTPNPNDMMDSNVLGTKNIMTAAMKAGVKRIIYTSSVAALGTTNDQTAANERTPSTLDEKIGPYKKSKFLAEAEVLKMNQEQGLPVIIVNPSAPMGPGDIKPTPTGQLVIQAARGKIPIYVESGLNVVHVDDVAKGHLLALRHGKEGEKYILGGENLSFLEILTSISELSGRRPPRIKLPHKLILPIAYVTEYFAKLFPGKEPFLNVDGVRMSMKSMYYSSQKAIDELGYRPRSAKAAFNDSINWFKTFGYID